MLDTVESILYAHLMPSNLQSRLGRIMRARGWSQADLARASGAAKQTVSDWLSDGYTQIDARFAYRLEDRSGFSAKWILLGTGPVMAIDYAKQIIQRHESGQAD